MKRREIILGVTGSIAAYKACELLRQLQGFGLDVNVVMTKGASAFVAPLTFSALSGRKVCTGLFEQNPEQWEIDHIALSDRADLLLIAPATANIIGKIANGIADDLLTSLALAVRGKILIAPAMNSRMYANNIVQENIRRLKKEGVFFINPVKGKLACGEIGPGHLSDTKTIVQAVKRFLKKK